MYCGKLFIAIGRHCKDNWFIFVSVVLLMTHKNFYTYLISLIMVRFVIKRDGRIVDFDKRKIVDAVLKAMNVTEEGEDIVLAAEIAAAIAKIDVESMSVEDIQDHVEMELMNSPRKEVSGQKGKVP